MIEKSQNYTVINVRKIARIILQFLEHVHSGARARQATGGTCIPPNSSCSAHVPQLARAQSVSIHQAHSTPQAACPLPQWSGRRTCTTRLTHLLCYLNYCFTSLYKGNGVYLSFGVYFWVYLSFGVYFGVYLSFWVFFGSKFWGFFLGSL